jgi:integrase/recombinase XerD
MEGHEGPCGCLLKSQSEPLRKYCLKYKPTHWLFEGLRKGKSYSARSLEQIFHRIKTAAKIAQPVTFHNLRHS